MSHPHSPADVLRAALIALGAGVRPDSAPVPTWPVYVDHLPTAPDNAVCVYNTTGVKDGRLMGTGETITHPGWQVRVRAKVSPVAWEKIRDIKWLMDRMRNLPITLDGDQYYLESVTQIGTPLPLGQETDAARRDHITLNGTMTIKEITP